MTCNCENCTCGKTIEFNRYINDKNGKHIGYFTIEKNKETKYVSIGWSFCDIRSDYFSKKVARSFAKEYSKEIFLNIGDVLKTIPFKQHKTFIDLVYHYKNKEIMKDGIYPSWVDILDVIDSVSKIKTINCSIESIS